MDETWNIVLEDLSFEDEWRPILDYPAYSISNEGAIYSLKKKKMISVSRHNRLGYYWATLFSGCNTRQAFMIHEMVAQAFVPNPMNYFFVEHLDGDTKNNNSANLRWCFELPDSIKLRTHLKLSKANVSGTRGVYWNTRKKRWVCQYKTKCGRNVTIGTYEHIEDAIKKREEAVFGHILNLQQN